LSTGAVGSGHLAQLGPDAWRVGGIAALEVGGVAAAVAWEVSRHGEWIERYLAKARHWLGGIRSVVLRRFGGSAQR
jgi:hypothetical protein